MAFGNSAYLHWLRQPASHDELKSQITLLLKNIDVDDGAIIDELSSVSVRQDAVVELMKWNERLKPSAARDRFGVAAVRFWVAQTLATTVMAPRALDQNFRFSSGVDQIMASGGDGIFYFGNSQFLFLKRLAGIIVSWLKSKEIAGVMIVESPLGNSVPVQVMYDELVASGIRVEIHVWNSPRNDRPRRGATVEDAAKQFASALDGQETVLFADDVSTGSRFLKLYDALSQHVRDDRLIPLALVADDTQKPQNNTHTARKRLSARLEKHAARLGLETLWFDVPHLRLFRLDEGPFCKWENALVWENSDLMAGKRKINLFFTLLDFIFSTLDDLANEKSFFRPYLEFAWHQDTTGQVYVNAPGLVRKVFSRIRDDGDFKASKEEVEVAARERFSADYDGDIASLNPGMDFVVERWDWLRDKFIATLSPKVDARRAWVAWRAVDDIFSASFNDRMPKPGRDQAATPYIIPFNKSLRSLNDRLRSRIASS